MAFDIANLGIVTKIITCKVCLQIFDEDLKCPRMLPACGHTFCHSCIGWLLVKSPSCPNCKTGIKFSTADSIPTNFSLKSLVNIFTSNVIVLDETNKRVPSQFEEGEINGQPRAKTAKLMSAGNCSVYKRPRFKEEPKEKKVQIRTVNNFRRKAKKSKSCMKKYLKLLNKQNYNLKNINEIDANEMRISKIETERFLLNVKLQKIEKIVRTSTNDAELQKLLNEGDQFPFDYIPGTYEELESLCQNDQPVYVFNDIIDGILYGKITVKDGRIWVDSFERKIPVGLSATQPFNFRKFLARFNGSTKPPTTVFLKLALEDEWGEDVLVLIKTNGMLPREMNLIKLCSALKGPSYKGMSVCGDSFCYRVSPGIPPVVKRISSRIRKRQLKEGMVYGMSEEESFFQIQLKDDPSLTDYRIGVIVAGLEDLKGLQEKKCIIKNCGLVI